MLSCCFLGERAGFDDAGTTFLLLLLSQGVLYHANSESLSDLVPGVEEEIDIPSVKYREGILDPVSRIHKRDRLNSCMYPETAQLPFLS